MWVNPTCFPGQVIKRILPLKDSIFYINESTTSSSTTTTNNNNNSNNKNNINNKTSENWDDIYNKTRRKDWTSANQMCSHIFLNIITAPSWYSRWTSSGRDCVNVDKALLYSKTVWRRDTVAVNTLKLYCNSSCRRAGGRDIITKSIATANSEALIKENKRTKRLC